MADMAAAATAPASKPLSFSLKRSDAPKPAAAAALGAPGAAEEDGARDYVLSFSDKKLNSSRPEDDEAPRELVIPFRAENKWYRPDDKGAVGQPPADAATASADSAAVQEILRDAQMVVEDEHADIGAIPLLVRNQAPGVQDARNDAEKFKIDVQQRPEECSLEEYASVPVELFGAALLKGMGWKEGEGIGGTNKGLVEPVVPIPRPSGLGLGASRDTDLLPAKKEKKYIKPGESREAPKEMMIAPGEDGKVRHFKPLSEDLVEKEIISIRRDAYVVVNVGPHKGHIGKIARLKDLKVHVQLSLGSETIEVPENGVTPISESEYFERRRELKKSSASSSSSSSKRKLDNDEEKDSKSVHKSSKTDEPSWLVASTRVRVISERYQGGKFYNKKVRILDVLTPHTCSCLTDEGVLLEDLRQKDLETVVPKNKGDKVLILVGKHKFRHGTLVERSSSKSKVYVQLSGEHDVDSFHFDDVCEYVGEED